MTFLNRIRIMLGEDICEHCGSSNVIKWGFEDWNHRHECTDCKKETVVLRV